ncbi:MAG: methyltransferase domain-containing protein [Pirellulales bacterium]|nr:methyltransferase domain-containing protein [Pirellulales bacterium]
MKDLTTRLIDCAADSFPMHGPVYEFGFSSAEAANARSSDNDAQDDDVVGSARIDRLEDLGQLPFPDAKARTVICENALQYVFEPPRAIAEMTRILAPGGLLVVVTSTHERATGANRYWTPSPGAMGRLLSGFSGTLVGWIGPDAMPHTVFGIACKSPLRAEFAQGVQPFLDRLDRRLATAASRIGVFQSLKRRLVEWTCTSGQPYPRQDDYRAQYALHLPVDEQSRSALMESCLSPTKAGTRLDLSE